MKQKEENAAADISQTRPDRMKTNQLIRKLGYKLMLIATLLSLLKFK